jgi:hypothetical protein
MSLAIAAGLGLGGNESYPDLFQPFGGFPDGVKVDNGHVVLPELPGIGFEGKADLYREMSALAAVRGVLGMGLPTVAMGLLGLVLPVAEGAALLMLPLTGHQPVANAAWQCTGTPVSTAVAHGAGRGWMAPSAAFHATLLLGLCLVVYAVAGLAGLRLAAPPPRSAGWACRSPCQRWRSRACAGPAAARRAEPGHFRALPVLGSAVGTVGVGALVVGRCQHTAVVIGRRAGLPMGYHL